MYESSNWEEVDEPHEPKLNVKALIVLDSTFIYDEDMFYSIYRESNSESCYECNSGDTITYKYGLSSVEIYTTMGLPEISQVVVNTDTSEYWYECIYDVNYWGGDPEQECNWLIRYTYQPASIIKDAEVYITDLSTGVQHEFTYIENDRIDINTNYGLQNYLISTHHYKDTTESFIPKLSTTYDLLIRHNEYDDIIGQLTTPSFSKIDPNLSDTLNVDQAYTINWNSSENQGFVHGYINEDRFHGHEFDSDDNKYFCGGRFFSEINLLDSSYVVFPDFIDSSDDYCSEDPVNILIKLVSMDQNYYEYFIVGDGKNFENFLLEGAGSSGQSMGIDGGYGVFGSYVSDQLFRTLLPQNYLE